MVNPEKPFPSDLMIKRLEEANARAHEKATQADERALGSNQDTALAQNIVLHPSDHKNALDLRSSRTGPVFLALVLVAVFVCIATLAWQSSYETIKLVDARGENALLPQARPLSLVKPQDATQISSELAQRVQTLESELANIKQEVEQLKTRQDRMTRDNTAVAAQLKASQEQPTTTTVASARKSSRRTR